MTRDSDNPRITAYLLDELERDERLAFESEMERSQALQKIVHETDKVIKLLEAEFSGSEGLGLSGEQRAQVEQAFASRASDDGAVRTVAADPSSGSGLSGSGLSGSGLSGSGLSGSGRPGQERSIKWISVAVCSVSAALLACLLIPSVASVFSSARIVDAGIAQTESPSILNDPTEGTQTVSEAERRWTGIDKSSRVVVDSSVLEETPRGMSPVLAKDPSVEDGAAALADFPTLIDLITSTVEPESFDEVAGPHPTASSSLSLDVKQSQSVELEKATDNFSSVVNESIRDSYQRGQVVGRGLSSSALRQKEIDNLPGLSPFSRGSLPETPDHGRGPGRGGDKYDRIVDNAFLRVTEAPLSTFSIDVDTASYSKVRTFITQHGQLPRPDAVRIEELVNYFPYSYAPPTDDHPFATAQAMATCPWNAKHRLVRIGIKGKIIEQDARPASNLVFLLDVSGSMDDPQKLPLLKRGMKMLVNQLTENDRVAIVVYAGAAGMVLDSTTGDQKVIIDTALDRLKAGGSTNGGEGIQLAYQTALDHFITGGVNRVILCTDGDFNVGTTGTDELVRTIEQHAKSGVFLSVLGFGMGNHNDAMLEQISNKGNGNYTFVDSDNEARKVLVEQMSSTLVTIAKDVKIQVEFNPQQVAAYRLIGYENRVLAAQDFNDDTKDAGEIGAGHTVTALYEIVPVGESIDVAPPVDDLKYQTPSRVTESAESGELLTLKIRFKEPDGVESSLLTFPLENAQRAFRDADADFQFAAAVASFGMLLRDSQFKGDASFASVLEIATAAAKNDPGGYRHEFLELVRKSAALVGETVPSVDN